VPRLLRWTKRNAPWAASRRTPARADPAHRRVLRASHGIEKRRRSFPSRRLWRRRCA
jgi:hypothetical protein